MTNNNDSSMYRTGDIVIGSSDPGKSVYSATGQKLIMDGVSIYGDEKTLQAQGEELFKAAVRSGGVPIRVGSGGGQALSKKTSKKKTTAKQQVAMMYDYPDYSAKPAMQQQPIAVAVRQTTIQFENSFGKMKAKVEHLVEHPQAFMLVFSDEDAVVFEPKIAESLILHTDDGRQVDVYYPGVTFNWPVDTKKLMVLFKIANEE